MNNQAIGIFDSGLGGLTVARAIAQRLPAERLIYFGDTARCPYGPRTLDEVRGFVREIGAWLCEREVKLIVIACNTATAAGLALAQREFNVPVVGVVEPGARAAVRATASRRVGVIATAGTVGSGAYTAAIHALDAGIQVTSAACPQFVEIVEQGLRGPGKTAGQGANLEPLRGAFDAVAGEYLSPIAAAGVDTLVLGCTHYPILAPLIAGAVGSGVRLISSADETAKDVAEILAYRGHLAERECAPEHLFVTTSANTDEFRQLGSQIFASPLAHVEHVELP